MTNSNTKYIFVIPLKPRIKKNSRPIYKNKKTGKYFIGKSEGLKDYEENGGILLQAQKSKFGIRDPLPGPYRVYFQFDFKGARRSDFDNLITCASDLLQKAGIIINDKLIIEGSWRVRDHVEQDRSIIQIESL